MVDALVDTSIVIDILRKYAPAVSWLHTRTAVSGVTRFVWYEVVEGAANKRKQQQAIRVLKKFQLVAVNNDDIEWAMSALLQHYLQSNVDTYDCLIASTAYRLQVPLYTGNLKHFSRLLGPLAQSPY